MLIYSNLVWKGFGIDWWLSRRSPAALTSILTGLWPLIRQDALPLPVGATFALADFRKALTADAEPGRRGKVLLTWSPPGPWFLGQLPRCPTMLG